MQIVIKLCLAGAAPVGEETGLVGSLRAAVLSLTLEEKGVAPDISAGLIDDLTIAEKTKTVFFAISPAYEIPVGYQNSADSIVTFQPTFYHLRLDAELPLATLQDQVQVWLQQETSA